MSSVPESIQITNDGVTLPIIEVLTGRGFICGKSGAGKSNSASVVVEELLKHNLSMLIVDIEGEYIGLKEQFEVLHAGADSNCDIEISMDHAEKIAEIALVENVPVILDISAIIDGEEAERLVKEVVDTLFHMENGLKKPFLILVEEMHEFVPQDSGASELGESLVRIGKRGRKRGLGLCGMSQRPAAVDKDYITQCDWLVWHRLTWDNDTKVAGRVLGSSYGKKVSDLEDGEAFMMTDWDGQLQRIQFKRKETFDAGATPSLEDIQRPDLKTVDSEYLDELESIEDANDIERDPTVLRAELSEKNARLRDLEQKNQELRDELEELRPASPSSSTQKKPERKPQPSNERPTNADRSSTSSKDRAASRRQATHEPDEFDPIWEFGQLVVHLARAFGRGVVSLVSVDAEPTPKEPHPHNVLSPGESMTESGHLLYLGGFILAIVFIFFAVGLMIYFLLP